jgi:protein-tyrosine phosphatase
VSPDQDVVADFLMTNTLSTRLEVTLEVARSFFGDKSEDFFAPALQADVAYLEAGITQLEREYGDVEGYLRKALALTDDQLDRLLRLVAG